MHTHVLPISTLPSAYSSAHPVYHVCPQEFVKDHMYQQGLKFHDVVFVDDSMSEVLSMRDTCNAIHVNTDGTFTCQSSVVCLGQVRYICF